MIYNSQNSVTDSDFRKPTFRFDYRTSQRILNYFQARMRELNKEHCYLLKQSHKQTLDFAMLAYINQVKEWHSHKEYPYFTELPPWVTSCKGLTKFFNHGSAGTIYGHRRRLIDLGLLVRVDSSPAQDRQGWYFNPLLFLHEKQGKQMVDKLVNKLSERQGDPQNPENKKLLETALNEVYASIFEHIEAGAIKETIDSNMDNVDNSPPDEEKRAEGAKAPDLICQSIAPEHRKKGAKKSCGAIEAPAEKQEQIPAAAAAKNTKQIGRKVPETGTAATVTTKRKTQFPPFLLALIVKLWAFAKAELYPDRDFTPEQERDILNAIYYSEFNVKKHDFTKEQWLQRYGQLIGQVRLARNYVEKHALYVPRAAYYFSGPDPDNPYAFKFCRTHDFIAKAAHDDIKREIKQWKWRKGRYANHSAEQLKGIHIRRLTALESKKYNNIFINNTIHSYVRKAGYNR